MSIVINVVLAAAAAAPPPTPTPTPAPVSRLATRGSGTARPASGSLADLAGRVKLRLPEGQGRVITNDSLKTLGAGVELTTAKAASPVDSDAGQGADAEEARLREQWQERYQAARAELEALEQEIYRLEGEVGRLESEFYATDDPVRRDTVVKPAWDKAIADLAAARERLADAQAAPDKVRDDALRDGALPGWFRGLPTPTPESGEKGAPAGGG